MTTKAGTAPDHDQQFAPPEAWDAIAAGYDEFVAPGEESFAVDALQLVGLRAGERFLDVAAGTGGLSLPAARLGAAVMATDWSPAMIERFESRVRAERLAAAQSRVMDGALREMVRVTRPEGRVVLIAYGDPARFEALQFFVAALQAVVPGFEGLPDDPPPLEFQVSDPDVMRARLFAVD